ncbi:MAG TPA: hypothetical protein PK400_08700 [Phycisphaerales bacterium]|nr:hypothetical protein [Phycisphaerales bacterium]HRQ74802.1 hypothetical protein [Phycisphaerales bacterium]
MMEMMAHIFWPSLLAFIGLAAASIAIISLLRSERAMTCRRLEAAFGLSGRERRALARLSRQSGIDRAALLISRGCFDAAMKRLEGQVRNRTGEEALRQRLFNSETAAYS